MSKRTIRSNKVALADRLRREAEASRPAFSEELYERICLVVKLDDGLSPPETASPRSETASPRPNRRLWLSVAATLLLAGTSLLAWQLNNPNTPVTLPPIDNNSIASIPQDLDGISEITDNTAAGALLVDSALTTEGWAYLDHDARVATELILNQLPLDALASSVEP
jgi:hypothetical protein